MSINVKKTIFVLPNYGYPTIYVSLVYYKELLEYGYKIVFMRIFTYNFYLF